MPSRFASREEFLALARAVRDFPGTTLEFIPTVGVFNEAQQDLMASMSLAANRPLNWNVLGVACLFGEGGRRAARGLGLRGGARRQGDRADALAGDEAAHQSGDGLHLRRAPGLGRGARAPASRAHAAAARPRRARAATQGSDVGGRRRDARDRRVGERHGRGDLRSAQRGLQGQQDRRDREGAGQDALRRACSISRSPRICARRSRPSSPATTKRAGGFARRSGAIRAP